MLSAKLPINSGLYTAKDANGADLQTVQLVETTFDGYVLRSESDDEACCG